MGYSVPFRLGLGLQPLGEVAANGGAEGPGGDAFTNLTIDFGFNKQHVGDQLWYDTDNNGVYDPGESPAPAGVVVVMHAIQAGDRLGPVLTTTTDVNGQYDFAAGNNVDLGAVPFRLYIAIPPGQAALNGYLPSTPRHVGGGLDSNNTGAIDASGVITSGLFYPLPASTANGALVDDTLGETYQPTIDFGFVAERFSLGNRVWYDTNDNGVLDAGEQPIPSVIIELLDSSDNLISTTVTDASGYYNFTNLPAGQLRSRGDRQKLLARRPALRLSE